MCVVSKPQDVNPFEFIVVSVLRTKQLLRGCTPRVAGSHKATVTAQMEVSAGVVTGTFGDPAPASDQIATRPDPA
jgi:DNA-directed RNA polymerase subunit K/omega